MRISSDAMALDQEWNMQVTQEQRDVTARPPSAAGETLL